MKIIGVFHGLGMWSPDGECWVDYGDVSPDLRLRGSTLYVL